MSCPICKKPTMTEFRPFCSLRCADVDLGRWVTGKYAIPAEDDDSIDDAAQAIENNGQNIH